VNFHYRLSSQFQIRRFGVKDPDRTVVRIRERGCGHGFHFTIEVNGSGVLRDDRVILGLGADAKLWVAPGLRSSLQKIIDHQGHEGTRRKIKPFV